METEEIVRNEAPYQPTAEQTQRAARLRRFNLAFVFLPIGLLLAIVIALLVFMIIVAINPPREDSLALLSGLADMTLILTLCPLVLLGAGLLGLSGYIYGQARKRNLAPVSSTQTLLWRLEALIARQMGRARSATALAVRPLMMLHGAYAYLKSLIAQLAGMVKRS